MKKILLLFIPLIFFFGCDKEEEEVVCLLEGIWSVNYIDYGTYCEPYCDVDLSDIPCTVSGYGYYDNTCVTLTFNSNEIVTMITSYAQDEYVNTASGTWSSGCEEGDNIIITEMDGDIVQFQILEISATTLKLFYSAVNETMVLTR